VRTLIPDPPPVEVEALLERRRRAGADRFDEVWEGVYHVVPGPSGAHAEIESQLHRLLGSPAAAVGLVVSGQFNLGESEQDFRVPDGGLHRGRPSGTWQHTAALVFEVRSPSDETWEKLPFCAARGVDEILIVDPQERSVSWLALEGGEYRPLERSGLIALGAGELSDRIDWPAAE
jgi:Uma2 family endonuclease